MNSIANFVPSELDELLHQTQAALLTIATDQPLLRAFMAHCPLSLCLRLNFTYTFISSQAFSYQEFLPLGESRIQLEPNHVGEKSAHATIRC